MRASKTNTDGRREDLRLVASPVARAVDALRAAEEHTAAEPGSSQVFDLTRGPTADAGGRPNPPENGTSRRR